MSPDIAPGGLEYELSALPNRSDARRFFHFRAFGFDQAGTALNRADWVAQVMGGDSEKLVFSPD